MLITWLYGVAIVVAVVWFLFGGRVRDAFKSRKAGNCIWCVMRLNSVVAFLPREEYDRESREHWKFRQADPNRFRLVHQFGDLIKPDYTKIVVVQYDAGFHHMLVDGLLLEHREFNIAGAPVKPYPLAYEFMRGRPWPMI